ncbi:OsmC family protein [Mangrovicoccus algicola]|uniref:OsmC family protein n=1 Tax=Mangrovicoccus algicola TaxID=2771008 RepID=A0A8J7CW93_9RHOB|nr:OsmC family protein [Mangrovicoccus algicola]MBE3637497.1 OsmC family protein [Mangrovicoccus algicola]
MVPQEFSLSGHDGADRTARLHLPQDPPLATAILAGGSGLAARRILARLGAMGLAVLDLDPGPDEDPAPAGTPGCDPDRLVRAAAALTARGLPPALLIGQGRGGTGVLRAAAGIEAARAMVTISPRFAEPPRRPGSQPALLVIHAARDGTEPPAEALRLLAAAPHPRQLDMPDTADPQMDSPAAAEACAAAVARFAAAHLPLSPPAPPIGAPEGVVRVSEADPDGFLQDVSRGPFLHGLADEPPAYGGTDRGLTPYGFLAAGLGACTSMTIRMYARRKGWALDHVSVEVTHDKVHAQDFTPESRSKVDQFRRVIRLEGRLDATQRRRLMEIAEHCPVHETLAGKARILTALAE